MKFLRKLIFKVKGAAIIVLDNLQVHHSKAVDQLIKERDRIEIQFLPPYSSTLNPIERYWNIVKIAWRQYVLQYAGEINEESSIAALKSIVDGIAPQKVKNIARSHYDALIQSLGGKLV